MTAVAHKLDLAALSPYKSLLVLQWRKPAYRKTMLQALRSGVVTIVGADPLNRVMDQREWSEAGCELVAIYYDQRRQCPWSSQPGFEDTFKQLVVILRRGKFVAVHCTDVRLRNSILSELGNDGSSVALPVEPGRLNAAFVTGAPARTIWLSGIHRRNASKADSKVLSGLDLRDALDPLEDQTYRFSSVRCGSTITSSPVGLSPRKAQLWAGTSSDWTDFRRTVADLLDHLDVATGSDPTPLPVLASSSPGSPTGAFDVALLPDDLFGSDPDLDAATRAQMEQIADHTELEIFNTNGPNFDAHVWLAGHLLGDIGVKVDASNPERVAVKIDGTAVDRATEQVFRFIVGYVRRQSWLKVRYESGHTVSDGALFSIRYRDMPFPGFLWGNFANYDITREKPSKLELTGTERSLFCWVQQFWPSVAAEPLADRGWLACDDGSMEIADFIHLDVSTTPPRLSLIHVKAAKNDETVEESLSRRMKLSPGRLSRTSVISTTHCLVTG